MASQITGVSIVCSTICSGADQRNHQSSASLAFVRGIHRWPVDSPHKGPITRKMFPLDDVIMNWIFFLTQTIKTQSMWRWDIKTEMVSYCRNIRFWMIRKLSNDSFHLIFISVLMRAYLSGDHSDHAHQGLICGSPEGTCAPVRQKSSPRRRNHFREKCFLPHGNDFFLAEMIPSPWKRFLPRDGEGGTGGGGGGGGGGGAGVGGLLTKNAWGAGVGRKVHPTPPLPTHPPTLQPHRAPPARTPTTNPPPPPPPTHTHPTHPNPHPNPPRSSTTEIISGVSGTLYSSDTHGVARIVRYLQFHFMQTLDAKALYGYPRN